MAHKPLGIHHLSSLTMMPSGSMQRVCATMSRASLLLAVWGAVVDTHWRLRYLRLPLGQSRLLHGFLGEGWAFQVEGLSQLRSVQMLGVGGTRLSRHKGSPIMVAMCWGPSG